MDTTAPTPQNLTDQSYEERWSEANVQKVISAWKLTSEEQQQLRRLQKSLKKDVTSWKNNPQDIVRYLRGPGKIDAVESKFRSMIDWRHTNQIDTLLETYRPPQTLLWYVPSAILEGYDLDGDPIYLERGGVMDGIGLQQRHSMEEIMTHVVWLREIGTRGDWLRTYETQTGRTPTQVTIIYDMQGMSSRHMKGSVMTMFKEIVAMNQTKYCGLAKRIILLRAPSIFQFIWNIAKHFCTLYMDYYCCCYVYDYFVVSIVWDAHTFSKTLPWFVLLGYLYPPRLFQSPPKDES